MRILITDDGIEVNGADPLSIIGHLEMVKAHIVKDVENGALERKIMNPNQTKLHLVEDEDERE